MKYFKIYHAIQRQYLARNLVDMSSETRCFEKIELFRYNLLNDENRIFGLKPQI